MAKLISLPRVKTLRLAATALTLLVSGGILGYLLISQREVLSSFPWQIRPVPFLISLLIFSLDLLLVAFIWARIMNTLGSPLPYRKHLRIFLISNITKRLPGTVWYVASRAQMYREEGLSRKFTSLASGVEFAISLLSSALVTLFFAIPLIRSYQFSLAALGLLLILGLGLVHPRVVGWIFQRLNVPLRDFNYRHTVRWLLAYLAAWVLGGLFIFTVADTLNPLPLGEVWYVIGSVGLVNILTALLFFAPSNLGVTEVGLSLLLANLMPTPVAVIVAISVRLLMIALELVWAMLAIWLF